MRNIYVFRYTANCVDVLQVGGEVEGKVTRAEFQNYYYNVSASIDSDQYFEVMIRNAWHFSPTETSWSTRFAFIYHSIN